MVFRLFRKKETTHRALARTRQGWGGGIRSLFEGAALNDEALWEGLEEALIAADVGVGAALGLVNAVRARVRAEGAADADAVAELFKEEMALLLDPADPSIWDWYDQPELPAKPFVLLVVGVNGTGKTTSVAKLAHHYGRMGKRVAVGACDTFRAAAIEQMKTWGERLQVDVVAHQQGSDPAAVAFDAYQAASARGADLLILDTAGRLHNKAHLLEELRKIKRVLERQDAAAPHQTLLVLDATTGHNGLEQARAFKDAPGLDAVFLAKLDGSAKGGIVVAVAQELRLPIVFIGTGEGLDDVALFDTDEFVDALLEERQPA